MTKIHVVPHTHWDREWYFTVADSSLLSAYNFSNVIDTLLTNEKYTYYHLDGQTSIVEDFLKFAPEYKEKLAKLVKDKRIFIGPWYIQTDTYNVSGESIIRNLKYGITFANKMGHAMKVGYLPDTFGHNSQMPTIFNNCGIDNIVFWRGINYDKQVKYSNFIWKSQGLDEIIACNFLYGYGTAKNINDSDQHLNNKIFPMVEQIKSKSNVKELMIPSGGDQVNITPNLDEILANTTCKSNGDEYVISSYENYIDYLRTQKSEFETYIGELKEPRYTRIHKTIGSVRYDIKKLNFDIEDKLLNQLEPLAAIARANNIHVNQHVIDSAWKSIIESHAHDSIGGCNSDDTNDDIIHRMKVAKQLVDGLYNIILKEINYSLAIENSFVVFNFNNKQSKTITVPIFTNYKNFEVISNNNDKLAFDVLNVEQLEGGKIIELTENGEVEKDVPNYLRYEISLTTAQLPTIGYEIYKINEIADELKVVTSLQETVVLEDYSLAFTNGNVNVTNLVTNETIQNFLTLEECADDGDSYDFSELLGDEFNYFENFDLIASYQGTTTAFLTLKADIKIPYDLNARVNKTTKINQEVFIKVSIVNNLVKVNIELQNKACDHRIRVILNTNVTTNKTTASTPFGYIERDIISNPTNWEQTYREIPIDIETTDSFINLNDNANSFSTYLKGMKEFQALNDQGNTKLALTLFKSVGVLGKDDLTYRPGRASGINNKVVHTPNAQLLNQALTFEFFVHFGAKKSYQDVRNIELKTIDNVKIYQNQNLNTFEHRLERFSLNFVKQELPKTFSLLSFDEKLTFSSVDFDSETNAYLLRLANHQSDAISVKNCISEKFTTVNFVNIPTKITEVKPHNAITLKVNYEK